MTKFLIYRHGSNKANQHMRDCMPVAIIEADSEEAAVACERIDPPGKLDPYAPAHLAFDKEVTIWANQYARAIPLAEAPEEDVREVEEG